jgi:hypothetical protein
MSVCCECCVWSSRGLCDELITRPEESYRLWRVVVCDQESSWMRRPWPALGRSATRNKRVGPLRWELVTEIAINDARCKNWIRNFKSLCTSNQSVTMSEAVLTVRTAQYKIKNSALFPFSVLYLMFPAILRVSLVLPYTTLEIGHCKEDAVCFLWVRNWSLDCW